MGVNKDPQFLKNKKILTSQLTVISRETRWPVNDYLDWFLTTNDIDHLIQLSMSEIRSIATEYLNNISDYRGDGYTPISDEIEPVRCSDCISFIRDEIGFYGIGDCKKGQNFSIPFWPNVKRKCKLFEDK